MTHPKTDTTAQLESGPILPLVFKLTVPAVVAQLITFLYNIVDRMFVAKIPGSGMDALAALGVVLPITLIIQALQPGGPGRRTPGRNQNGRGQF